MKKIILSLFVLLFLLTTKIVFAGSATVSWNANSEPDLAGYNIYYGTTSRNGSSVKPYPGSTMVSVTGTTTKAFTGLTEGATYYFSVTAYDNSNNESEYSQEVVKEVPFPTCTSFTYSSWSTCSNSTQSRTIQVASPENCVNGSPVLTQSCATVTSGGGGGSGVSPTCDDSTTFTNWSECSVYGVQTRSILAAHPIGCSGGSFALQQNCVYNNSTSTCSSFEYTAWSGCIKGKQTRSVVKSSPNNCLGGNRILEQSCSSDSIGATSTDITAITTNVKNINNTAASSGSRDDDNDGLSNDLETAIGSNPFKKDTDGDGYDDKQELLASFNFKGNGKMNGLDEIFANKQKGKIFIQVDGKGEAWYINPNDGKRYYLSRPKDAFNIMRKFSLGVKHKFITDNQNKAYASKYRGKILLDVEDKGKAYYIDLRDGKSYYLGSPANAFDVIRKRGIGIKNNDLEKVRVGLIN